MITFMLLLGFVSLFLIGIAVIGAGFIAVFGDILICIALIVFLVKLFTKKKDESQN